VKAPQADWADLVQRAQAGDGNAYSELFQQLHTPVLNYIYRTVGDRPAAEDITQDAFIRAHQRISQLGPPYDFKSWVFRIASNLAIDSLRQNKRFVDLDEPMDPLGPMTTKRPAERKVQQDQARQSVQATLALMPTTYRQAIVLRELNGLGYQDVANALECSYDNARQLVHRARLNFRELHGIRLMATSGAVQCRALDDLLSASQDGELTKEDQKSVRKHIKSCAYCKETEKDLRKVAGIVAGLTPILPSPDWVEALLEKFQSDGIQPTPAQSSPAQPSPAQHAQKVGPASGGGMPAGTAVSGSSWVVKLGIGATVALFGAGALIAVGAWAFNQFVNLPSGIDQGAIEKTVQAIVELTPPSPTPIQAQVTEEPAVPPPPPPLPSTPTPTADILEDSLVTLGPPIAVALVNSNCRGGPNSIYNVIDYLLQDEQTPIVGRDAGWFWWVVERKNSPGTCWIANNLTDELGDISQVPIMLAPPTPTPADTQGPTLSLSHMPKNPLSNQLVNFEVIGSDPSDIAWIEIWVRPPGQSVATLLGTCNNTSTCRIQGGPYPAGKGQYFARAEDKAGNRVESSVVNFNVSWYVG
jgi:RNA polymerase sigma-70 factor (ECF subfamily)